MGAFFTGRARSAWRLFAPFALALACAAAPQALAATLTVLVNSDNVATTGCSVATPNGAFDGVEQRFVTTVDTTQNPPRVTGITRETCAAGVFAAPVSVSAGGWPVGLGNGTGGYDVIETGLPIGTLGPVRVAVIYSDPAIGTDAVTVATAGGPIIVFSHAPGHIEQVPTLSDAMLVILTLVMVAVGWKYGRRHFPAAPLAVVALVMVTTIAWAAILLDGLTGDWTGIPPAASDGVDAPDGADISAVFGRIEGTTLFMRVDARVGRPPAAVADSYSAVSGTPLNIAAAAGVMANDTRGIPAATVTSFGGGSVGGSVTTNTASGTATFGVGGSLTVNAGGGFAYTPATGFTGPFTFSYRISSINGTSDATVTINTQSAPAITSANATAFNVGTAGTFTVTATGFPAPTFSAAGALPAGVTFNTATGVLSGTPTAAGTFPLVITAANGVAPNATQNFTLTVNQTVAITSANATTFTVGSAGTFTITTSATPTATNISIGGALPAGVTLGATSGTGTAVLSGTPTGPGGVFTLTITASNGGVTPNGTQTFTLTVNQAPAITSVAAATFQVGTAGTHTVVATGFPAPTLSMTGALPAGVTFDPTTGVLAGTATAAGTFPLVFTAANGVGANATQNFTLTVNQTVAITSANAVAFTVGAPGTFTITTSATPVANLITITGALPAGVTLGATSGTGTAVLSGTPNAGTGGAYVVTITASNGGVTPNGTQTFTLTVNQAPAITSGAAATFTVGAAGTHTVTATGFPAPTFAVTAGTLPAGVTLNPTTGALAGTPGAGTGGSYPITITASNGVAPNATQAFTLTVNQAPVITSANATTFTVGALGTFTVVATGVPASTFSFTGALPAGVSLSAAGVLSGTPGAGTGGLYPITITANNGIAPNAVQNFTLAVNQAPAITSANGVTFDVGTPGTFTVTTTGFPAPTIARGGAALPGGVTFVDNGNGTATLSGTPAAGSAGLYAITFTATNVVAATAPQAFTLSITDSVNAVDDGYTLPHDFGLPLNVGPPGVLLNDTGTPLPNAVTSVTGTGPACTVFPCTIALANGSAVIQSSGSFAYTANANFAGINSFTYVASNGATTDTATVTITVTNALPVIDLDGVAGATIDFAATFTEGGGAVPIVDAAALTVTDADDSNLESATVTITNIQDAGAEILGFTCTSAVPGFCEGAIPVAGVVYTAGTGVLAITANAPLADYQKLLRTITYNNVSANPTGVSRTVTFAVNDGIAANSPLANSLVTIAGVNGAPLITAPNTTPGTALPTPVNTALAFAGNVSVSDPDAGTADITVTLVATNGTMSLSGTAGLTTVTGNGTASVSATGPIASLNAALNNMTFNPTAAYTGPATLVITANDLGNTGLGGAQSDTHTVHVLVDSRPTVTSTIPVNLAPSVSGTSTITLNFSENVTVTAASFTINCSVSGARPFTFSGSGTSLVILTPNTALPAGEVCTVTVVAANVTDSVAQTMSANHVFSFTVNSLPTVTSTTPTNGATAIQLASDVLVNFSEPVNVTAASFTISCATSGAHAFVLSGSGAAYTLDPGVNFTAGELCTATVLAAQVTDVDASQNMAANYVFSFTIGTPPAFTSGNSVAATVGTALNFAVSTTGTPTITSLVSASVTPGPGGTLPSGLAFTYGAGASGAIAGTPNNAAHVGTYVLSFTASNGIAPDAVQNPFTLTLACPVITLGPAPATFAATYATPFTQAFTPAGGTAPYTYVLGGAALPAVAFSGNNLAGTPGNTGSFAFTVQAVDNFGCTSATQSYTLNVNPAATADAYNALGNVLVDSSTGPGTPFTVVSNDNFPAGTATISAFDAASLNGGTVTMTTAGANLGRFTYNPPVGFTGSDSFTYTLSSNGRTAVGTVTFTVAGKLWFINNAVGACPGAPCNGRMTHPFVDTAAFQAVNVAGTAPNPTDNDPIFVHSGNYAGGPITLRNGQRLIGQAAAAGQLATLAGVTVQNGQTLPSTAGATPVLNGAVTLGQNNFIHGLTLAGNTALSGTNFGTLTVNDNVTISTAAGAGLNLATGTANVTLVALLSGGGTNNVNLNTVAGTLALGSGALSGATGNAFNVTGGTATITYGGTIASGSARSVSIASKTAGTVTFNGAITDTDTGISLTNNTGATIAFTGGLTLSPNADAFSATGGGTVTVTGANNTINNTNGTALTVTNTTIGAAGLTFRRIDSTLGTANGITLINTGALGGLTVTGDGANTAVGGNGTGGNITNKSGANGIFTQGVGIYLSNTRNVVLRRMQISGTNQNYGIRGDLVDGFTLEYSTVNGTNGNAATLAAPENAGEGSIYFGNVTTNGIATSGTFTNNLIGGGRARNLSIINTAGTTTLTIKGNSFQLNQNFSDANQSLLVEARGGTVNATLGGAVASEGNIFAGAPGDNVNFTGQTGSTMSVTMRTNALANSHAQNIIGGGGLTLASQGSMTFLVDGNSINGAHGSAVTLFKAATATLLSGTFSNNMIGTTGVANSGSETGNGIFVSAAGTGTMTFAITNNQIRQYAGNAGIYADNTGGSYAANFTITGNTIAEPGAGAFAGLAITNGAPASADTIAVCAAITGNNVSTGDPANANDIIVGASGAGGGSHPFRLPGYAGTTLAQVEAFILANNNVPGTVVFAYADAPGAQTDFVGGAACALP